MDDFGFFIFLAVLLVCFIGEPDLVDRLIWGQGHPILEQIRNGAIEDDE